MRIEVLSIYPPYVGYGRESGNSNERDSTRSRRALLLSTTNHSHFKPATMDTTEPSSKKRRVSSPSASTAPALAGQSTADALLPSPPRAPSQGAAPPDEDHAAPPSSAAGAHAKPLSALFTPGSPKKRPSPVKQKRDVKGKGRALAGEIDEDDKENFTAMLARLKNDGAFFFAFESVEEGEGELRFPPEARRLIWNFAHRYRRRPAHPVAPSSSQEAQPREGQLRSVSVFPHYTSLFQLTSPIPCSLPADRH